MAKKAAAEQQTRPCKGPLHKNEGLGTQVPLDSFASSRSPMCRNCQHEYDRRRGSSRGATRASKKEERNNKQQSNNGEELPDVMSVTKGTPELGLKGKGVERISVPVINKAISKYVELRDEHREVTEALTDAKADLIKAMKDNKDKLSCDAEGVMIYSHDDLKVTLTPKDTVKVRSEDEEGENGGE